MVRLLDALLVGIVGASLYLNTLSAGFLFDDTVAIRTNADVVHPNITTLADVWANDFWGQLLTLRSSHKSYRPLTILTFRWTVQLFGHEPWAFHAGNVAIYGVCCFVWTCFVQRLGLLSRGGALAAGLLFAAHPMHVENVAQLVGRADTLGMIFFFLSVWAYLEGARGHGRGLAVRCGWGVAACVLCFASMLSKEVGLLALAVGAGVDVIVVGRALRWETWGGGVWGSPLRGAVLRLVAAGCVSVGFLWWGVWMRGARSYPRNQLIDNPIRREESLANRVLWATEVHAWYLTLLFYPAISCHDWGYNVIPLPTTPWRAACAYAVVFGVPLAALRTEWRERVAVATVLLVIPFVPASHALPIGTMLAERLLLIPSTGYALGAGVLVDALGGALPTGDTVKAVVDGTGRSDPKKDGKAPKGADKTKNPPTRPFPLWVWGAVGLVFAWYGGLTVRRNEDWRNPEALYAAGARTCSESAKGWIQVAAELKDQNRMGEAGYREALENAVRIHPNYSAAYMMLADAAGIKGTDKEVQMLQQAYDLDPKDIDLLVRLGELFSRQGRHGDAVDAARAALELGERRKMKMRLGAIKSQLAQALFFANQQASPQTWGDIDEIVRLFDDVIMQLESTEKNGIDRACDVRSRQLVPALVAAGRQEQAHAVVRGLSKRCVALLDATHRKVFTRWVGGNLVGV